jgi:hypothetical protein
VAERDVSSRLLRGSPGLAKLFSEETQEILDRADRAIKRSRELAEQHRLLLVECKAILDRQEARFVAMRLLRKPK